MPDVQVYFPDGPSVCVVVDSHENSIFVDNESPENLAVITDRRELEIAKVLLEMSLRNVNAALEIAKTDQAVVDLNVTRYFRAGKMQWRWRNGLMNMRHTDDRIWSPSCYDSLDVFLASTEGRNATEFVPEF